MSDKLGKYSRRDFFKMAGLGVASMMIRPESEQENKDSIKFPAIVGKCVYSGTNKTSGETTVSLSKVNKMENGIVMEIQETRRAHVDENGTWFFGAIEPGIYVVVPNAPHPAENFVPIVIDESTNIIIGDTLRIGIEGPQQSLPKKGVA